MDSSRDVLIEHTYIDTGDDAIALKSGEDEAGRRYGKACFFFVIFFSYESCLFTKTGTLPRKPTLQIGFVAV